MPSSVVVQNSLMWNDVGEMRGVVETSSFPSFGGSVSVSIVGCSFDSFGILGKDGIGLSLTRAPLKNVESVGRMSSSLIGCSFVNMSSIGSSRQPRVPHLDQKMLGCVVSLTSSHLSGSTIRDVNTVGCVLCSNSSFSSLLSSPNTDSDTNEEPSIILPDGSAAIFDDSEEYLFNSGHGTAASSISISHCHFTSPNYASNVRPLTFDEYPGSITLLSCSFANAIRTTGSGGAVFIDAGTTQTTNHVKVELCNFTSCSASFGGGGLYLSSTAIVTVTGCRCVGCSLTGAGLSYGGGMFVELSSTPDSAVFDMEYERCTSPYCAGGLSVRHVEHTHRITSLSFKECSAGSTPSGGIGGGMNISAEWRSESLITASFLSFEDCRAGIKGGGLLSDSYDGPVTLTDCEFVRCSSDIGECGTPTP
ncbi:hypothetical protein BLNAU_23242 [Blattamonas nauphoetae]|uniref:Right handed beta helix domain-containing protein n=1 Tax=Blattamonas nauphoetae TaxID=2049346 RepID=A0ABQ9WQV1_9EUKA|nr:hypothetical protein BLNAU_23242 [Blattamonas nauphoetae]